MVNGISTRDGDKEKVVQAAVGISFSIVLTESGKGMSVHTWIRFCLFVHVDLVFSFGSAEKGQLGNGTTGERITTGNKTAFDIEPSPSRSMLPSLSFILTDPACSLYQGAGRQAHCADRFWATT